MDVFKNKSGKVFKNALIYFMLITLGYVFLYPLIYAFSMSFMSYEDTLDPTIYMIASEFMTDNYQEVVDGIKYLPVMFETFLFAFACAVAQTISCGIIGYGFGKYNFPFKRLFLAIILFLFVVPLQVTTIPTYLTLQQMNLVNSPLGLILPALFGQGLKSTIFILIYFQVFDAMPKVLDEAAQVDGAGEIRKFSSIAVPLAKPAILLTFLFSFIWYWNETYLTTLYFGQKFTTLPIQLRTFVSTLNATDMASATTGVKMFQNVEMAGVILSILPLIVMYLLLQKHFTESIDKTGITGE